jgi:hypothetical protein
MGKEDRLKLGKSDASGLNSGQSDQKRNFFNVVSYEIAFIEDEQLVKKSLISRIHNSCIYVPCYRACLSAILTTEQSSCHAEKIDIFLNSEQQTLNSHRDR